MMNPESVQGLMSEIEACPLCGAQCFEEVMPARYPEGITREDLVKVYRSSSDRELMDRMVRCRECDLHFLNPRIDSQVILEGYTSAEDSVFFGQNEFRIQTFKRNFRKVADHFGLAEGARVLDVGCAGGAFPKAATELGFKAVGVEPSRWLCERGKKEYGLDLRPGTLREQKFETASFDCVTLWDVIEHLTDPKTELAEIRRILKPGGLLVVNYPDLASWARRLLRAKWPFFLGVHLFYFTPNTIRKLLVQQGFDVLEVRPFWQTLGLGYVMKRASAYLSPLEWVEKAASQTPIGGLPLTYNMGQSLVVARNAR